MKFTRTAACVSAVLVLTPTAAEARTLKPTTLAITTIVEQCAFGFTWVEFTARTTLSRSVDVWVRGDSDNPWGTYVDQTVDLPVGSTVVDVGLSFPQQVDVVLTKPGDPVSRPLVARSVAAVSSCATGW